MQHDSGSGRTGLFLSLYRQKKCLPEDTALYDRFYRTGFKSMTYTLISSFFLTKVLLDSNLLRSTVPLVPLVLVPCLVGSVNIVRQVIRADALFEKLDEKYAGMMFK